MYRFLIVIACSAILLSCANVWRFEKNALVAHGERINGSKEPLYYTISLDMTKSNDEHTKGILLKLTPDSKSIPLKDLNPELVAQYLTLFIPPPQWPNILKERMKAENAYAGNGFYISFKNNKLVWVSICSNCANGRESPVIGTPDGEHFYILPLTEKQMIEVFGSPKRIHRVNEVRY